MAMSLKANVSCCYCHHQVTALDWTAMNASTLSRWNFHMLLCGLRLFGLLVTLLTMNAIVRCEDQHP